MNNPVLVSLISIALCSSFGCGKKDGDKAAPADKPAAAAADKPAAGPLSAADLPTECKPFMDALEALQKCEKLPAETRKSMADGNQQMLKAMVDLGDKKAMIDGCQAGAPGLQEAMKTAGC